MPKRYCFLCASDEGVFLDVTKENVGTFHEQLEVCSISQGHSATEKLPSTVCYKCMYELNQCSNFVQKYKRGISRQKKKSQGCCCFCSESAKRGYIFDLNKDNNPVHNPSYKIQKLFNHDFKPHEGEVTLICLNCRYTLDVLFDLKRVFEETTTKLRDIVDEEIDYLNFPKTRTTVVSRKTTTTESAKLKLNTPSDSDNDSDAMARGKTRITKLNNNKTSAKPNLRICDKCHNSVDSGNDMYRFHRTGLTVCKSCWITMDPTTRKVRKKTKQSTAETKLCAVFLKDILTDSEHKEGKVYRVEQDDEGNKMYIITDDSSEGESRAQKPSAEAKTTTVNNRGSITTRSGLKRLAEGTKSDSTDSEAKPTKKLKPDDKPLKVEQKPTVLTRSSSIQKTNNVTPTLPKPRATKSSTVLVSDSEATQPRVTRKNNNLAPRRAKTSVSSLSDAELENKSTRRKLRNVVQAVAPSKPEIAKDSSSSNDDATTRRKKTRVASASPTLTESQSDKKESVKRTRSSSTSGNERPSGKFRIPTQKRTKLSSASSTEASQKSQSEEETEVKDITSEKKEFACDECGVAHGSKLELLTHKLTHCKQPEIKLEKVSLEKARGETAESSASQPVDEQGEDQSIVITVDDDEEEGTVDVEGGSDIAENALKDVTDEVTKDAADDVVEDVASDVEKEHASDEAKEVTEDVTTPINVEDEEPSVEKETEDAVETQLVVDGCVSDHDQEITTTDPVAPSVEETEGEKATNTVDAKPSTEEEENRRLSESSDKESNDTCRLIRDTRVDSNDSSKEDKDNYKLVVEEITKPEETDCVDISKDNDEAQDMDVQEVEEVEEENKETDVAVEIIEDKIDLTKSTSDDQSKTDKEIDDNVIDIDALEASKKDEHSRTDEKDVESETDIKIVDTGSSENSTEQDASACPEPVDASKKNEDEKTETETQDVADSTRSEEALDKEEEAESGKEMPKLNIDDPEEVESNVSQTVEIPQEKSSKDSANMAMEVLQEVFDLATAEVQKRQDTNDTANTDNADAETLENITREIENSADMPSLDPINNSAEPQENNKS